MKVPISTTKHKLSEIFDKAVYLEHAIGKHNSGVDES
jgi:hypothetical protein